RDRRPGRVGRPLPGGMARHEQGGQRTDGGRGRRGRTRDRHPRPGARHRRPGGDRPATAHRRVPEADGMTRIARRSPLPLLLVPVLLAGLAACSALGGGGTVSVLATWTGGERTAFERVLNAFTAKTGIAVEYQGSRALNQVLLSRVQRGEPPDIAV